MAGWRTAELCKAGIVTWGAVAVMWGLYLFTDIAEKLQRTDLRLIACVFLFHVVAGLIAIFLLGRKFRDLKRKRISRDRSGLYKNFESQRK